MGPHSTVRARAKLDPTQFTERSSSLTMSTVSRIQKYSSYAFSAFLTMHIANTALIPLATGSVRASESYLLLTRPYYQSMPFEALLITAPLALHVSSGIALRLFRRRQQVHRYGAESFSERRRIGWPRVSGTSWLGFALVPLVAGHAFLNRVLPLMYGGGSANVGLEYVSHLCARSPAVSFVGLSALVLAGAFHVTWGWAKWLAVSPDYVKATGAEGQLLRKKRWYLLNGTAAMIAVVWLAGGLGVIGRGGAAEGWLAKEYDTLLGRIPLLAKIF